MNSNSVIKLIEIKENDVSFIENVNRIYHHSFPVEERRDFDKFLELMYHNEMFTVYAIIKDEAHVGFITVWDLGEFAYVEHFAIDPDQRGGGIGQKSIVLLLDKVKKPFILEVEPESDEITARRINFYKRCGFTLNTEIEDFQPPYREGEMPLEFKLIIIGGTMIDDSHL